jgi:DNA-binding IclR family transcriptional regulator
VNDFLDEKRQEITNRLKELKPAVDEFKRLEAAAAALAGVGGSSSAAAPRRRGPGRPRGSVNRKPAAAATATKTAAKPARKPARKAARRRAGRRKGSGTRAIEAFTFVQGQPGITIPELAAKMGIKQNYLYRVLPGLEQEGKVTKRGRGWHPKA